MPAYSVVSVWFDFGFFYVFCVPIYRCLLSYFFYLLSDIFSFYFISSFFSFSLSSLYIFLLFLFSFSLFSLSQKLVAECVSLSPSIITHTPTVSLLSFFILLSCRSSSVCTCRSHSLLFWAYVCLQVSLS